MPSRSGYELPLLLLEAFRAIIDELHGDLAEHGHGQVRPIHGFALQALGAEGATIGQLGVRLGVTKQAAAKTARNLEAAGYASRIPNPDDGRSSILVRTPLGIDLLDRSAQIFDQLHRRWSERLGRERIEQLEDDLATLAGRPGPKSVGEFPGWLQESV